MVRVPLVVHDLHLVVGGTERENLFKNEINSFKYHNNVTKVQSKITHEIAEICFVSISACYTVMFMHVISYRLKQQDSKWRFNEGWLNNTAIMAPNSHQ